MMASGFRGRPELRLGHSGTALAAFFLITSRLGLKLGNNRAISGKTGVPPAEPRERPEPQADFCELRASEVRGTPQLA